MNAYFIKGYINNDKQYKFQAYINTGDEGNQFNSSIGYKEEKIGRLLKEKDAKDRLTVDEIIEKEHLDKMNMKPSHRCSSFRDRWIRFGCMV